MCGFCAPKTICEFYVLCVHWLTDGGEHREKLWDIYYAVENRPADFDWERCLDAVGETRKKWIICCIVLANRYLGLNLDGIPLTEESREIPQWLLETIEKEWKSDLRLKSLEYCLSDKKQLFSQIKKRSPPNPIQATVEMEEEFDHGWRVSDRQHSLSRQAVRQKNLGDASV